ncbi:hypothetical protein [Lysobacter gummosus]|uniref:hypothetical protein n=1 Tax=Lysobacter gummosus TaxID=262324 RepID=UPI003640B142
MLRLRFCRCWARLVTRETRDTRRAAHMDVRRVPPWAGCPMWHLPATATHSWLLTRNSPKRFLWLLSLSLWTKKVTRRFMAEAFGV